MYKLYNNLSIILVIILIYYININYIFVSIFIFGIYKLINNYYTNYLIASYKINKYDKYKKLIIHTIKLIDNSDNNFSSYLNYLYNNLNKYENINDILENTDILLHHKNNNQLIESDLDDIEYIYLYLNNIKCDFEIDIKLFDIKLIVKNFEEYIQNQVNENKLNNVIELMMLKTEFELYDDLFDYNQKIQLKLNNFMKLTKDLNLN